MSTGPGGQTFVSRRQVHTFFTFSVTLDYSALRNAGDEAGVSVFLLQLAHFDLGVVMLPTNDTSNVSHVSPYLRFRVKAFRQPGQAPKRLFSRSMRLGEVNRSRWRSKHSTTHITACPRVRRHMNI